MPARDHGQDLQGCTSIVKLNFDRRDFLLVSGAACSLPLLTAFKSADDRLAPVRDAARKHVKNDVPSLSLAVIHRGRPIWVEAFGWADRERRIPARTTTPYAIASASKPFTGLAVAQLVQAGLIRLDDPIENYLAGITINSRNGAAVTVRQALQHRSGIGRHWRNFFAGQEPPPSFAMVARGHAFTTAAQGKRYLYSNINYGLLAAAVAEVTGQAFHEHLRQAILHPLALTSAGSLNSHFGKWTAAIPYEEDGKAIPPYRVDEAGARDLVMSAFDLAQFGLAHADGRLGVASALMVDERMPLNMSAVGKAAYGLGWIVEEDTPAALFSYGHTGEGPGAASSLAIVPDEQLVVATIANQQGPAAYMLNEMIVDAMSERFAARRKAHPFQNAARNDEALRELAGRWEGAMETAAGSKRVSITLAPDAASKLVLDELEAELGNVAFREGVLTGGAALRVPAPDAQRWPHQARLALEESNGQLDGTLAAYASRDTIAHEQFWLSYPLRLQRR